VVVRAQEPARSEEKVSPAPTHLAVLEFVSGREIKMHMHKRVTASLEQFDFPTSPAIIIHQRHIASHRSSNCCFFASSA
jgi:hypothetical protein